MSEQMLPRGPWTTGDQPTVSMPLADIQADTLRRVASHFITWGVTESREADLRVSHYLSDLAEGIASGSMRL